MRTRAGLSLVELMVAVAVIGILVALALPRYHAFLAQARRGEAKSNLAHLASLQAVYKIEHFRYYSGSALLAPDGGIGYKNEDGTRGDCGDYADDRDLGLNNHLGFRPQACGQLRYFYQLRPGNVAVAFAYADAEGRYIYPDCHGGGREECDYTRGDAVRMALRDAKPTVCRNITKYCPAGMGTPPPPPPPTPTPPPPPPCDPTTQCCDGNTEVANTFSLTCNGWWGTFNDSAPNKGCCRRCGCTPWQPAVSDSRTDPNACEGESRYEYEPQTRTCSGPPPCPAATRTVQRTVRGTKDCTGCVCPDWPDLPARTDPNSCEDRFEDETQRRDCTGTPPPGITCSETRTAQRKVKGGIMPTPCSGLLQWVGDPYCECQCLYATAAEADITCPSATPTWNSTTCQCECPLTATDCPHGVDSANCTCSPKDEGQECRQRNMSNYCCSEEGTGGVIPSGDNCDDAYTISWNTDLDPDACDCSAIETEEPEGCKEDNHNTHYCCSNGGVLQDDPCINPTSDYTVIWTAPTLWTVGGCVCAKKSIEECDENTNSNYCCTNARVHSVDIRDDIRNDGDKRCMGGYTVNWNGNSVPPSCECATGVVTLPPESEGCAENTNGNYCCDASDNMSSHADGGCGDDSRKVYWNSASGECECSEEPSDAAATLPEKIPTPEPEVCDNQCEKTKCEEESQAQWFDIDNSDSKACTCECNDSSYKWVYPHSRGYTLTSTANNVLNSITTALGIAPLSCNQEGACVCDDSEACCDGDAIRSSCTDEPDNNNYYVLQKYPHCCTDCECTLTYRDLCKGVSMQLTPESVICRNSIPECMTKGYNLAATSKWVDGSKGTTKQEACKDTGGGWTSSESCDCGDGKTFEYKESDCEGGCVAMAPCPAPNKMLGGHCCHSSIEKSDYDNCTQAMGEWRNDCTCICHGEKEFVKDSKDSVWKCVYQHTIYQNCFTQATIDGNQNIVYLPTDPKHLTGQHEWKKECLGDDYPTLVQHGDDSAMQEALQTLLNCATEAEKKEGNMHGFITAARIRGGLNNLCPSGENINDLVIYLE